MPRFSPEQIIDSLYGPLPKTGQKKLDDFLAKGITKPEKPKSIDDENYASYDELAELFNSPEYQDKLLAGQSFETLIDNQEKFYQKMYGSNFQLDRSRIKVEKERLETIKQGLELGCVNFPLIVATPETLTNEESQMTEAELNYRKLLEPLKAQDGLKIWAETGQSRWTNLTLPELLKNYRPVEINDFDPTALAADWQAEFKRIYQQKSLAPLVQPNQIKLVFTDARPDVPASQPLINQDNQVINLPDNQKSFIQLIQNKIKVLSPDEWTALAAQIYAQDKTYLSLNTWNWQMAICKHESQTTKYSAADASSNSVGVSLNSDDAGNANDRGRWRSSL